MVNTKSLGRVALLSMTSLSGCASLIGTFAADPSVNKVYIGSRTDVQLLEKGCPGASPCLLPRPVAALDLPFSFVTDTLLLIYTVPSSASSH